MILGKQNAHFPIISFSRSLIPFKRFSFDGIDQEDREVNRIFRRRIEANIEDY